tara:strand:+ start:563 stop:1045 length:483 start_codon:yes stop_codon:yes gene_type:complete
MTRAISVYSLWSSSAAAIYGKSLTREERKKEWDRFEKKHPEDFAKLQRKADRENKKAGVETKKTKATKATKATKKESVKCADGVCKKRAPRKQSLTTLQKKLVTAEKNLKKATQAVSDIKADIKKRKEEEEEEEADSSSEDEDSSSEEEDSDSDSDSDDE